MFNAGNVFGNVAGGLVLGVVSGGAGYVGTAARMLGYAGDVYQAGKALSTGDWQTLAIQVASQAAGYAASKSAAGRAATKETPTWKSSEWRDNACFQTSEVSGWCFLAGTAVATQTGSTPIEQIKVGDRVLTVDDSSDQTEVDENTWLAVTALADNPDRSGDVLEITRLCSPQWVISHGCKPGATVHAELEELQFSGDVRITSIAPCPKLERGRGRVVMMTVTHLNSFVWELELAGVDAQGHRITETLRPTNLHKLYSQERGWVSTEDLRVGEVLRTQTGAATITSSKRIGGTHRVYNFEVEATHQYFVGETRTLSHNASCGGRRGNAATRAHVDQVRDDFLAANPGWKHTHGGTIASGPRRGLPRPEEFIKPIGGGRKGGSYADLSFEGPNGEKFRINTADTYAGGGFTTREETNAERIFQNTGGEPISMIPKPKACPLSGAPRQ